MRLHRFTANSISFFLLVFLVFLQQVTSSYRQLKLLEFRSKLQHLASPSFNPVQQSDQPSVPEQSGRVFYPIGYGADPTGAQESSDAILNALADASRLPGGGQLLPGVTDLGGVVVDLQGGNYIISKPIRFPSGAGNVLIQGGTLRASGTFPTDRYLIELRSPDSSHPNNLNGNKQQKVGPFYEAITFRDILFDSNYRGGGLAVINSSRIRITSCFFLHFTTQGILVQKGHETFISNSFLGQHSTVGGDKDERNFSGTAIDLNSNDNAITDVSIFSAAIGIVVRGQSNIITGVHCYNKATAFGGIGMLLKYPGDSNTRIDNCYLDFTAIVIEDPINVHVTDGFFLGDANIVLKANMGRISGLTIVNNMFNGSPTNRVPIIALEGQFTDINQVVIDQNVVLGMVLKSTVGKLTVAGNGTKWVADFSSQLVFRNRINHFYYSFYSSDQGVSRFSTGHAVTNVSNNAVVVESKEAVDAVVSVVVDQYNMAGETSFSL